MRTNRVQRHICDFIIDQVTWWRDSNDIDSPTHTCDLECRIDDIVEDEGWLDGDTAHRLEGLLSNLLAEIRKLEGE